MRFVSPYNLPLAYLKWHYTFAWSDLWRLYANFSWFLWNFFSVALLAGTLFSPWRRLREPANNGIGGIFGSVILNLMLRLVGLFMRLFTVSCGLAALAFLAAMFACLLALWPLLPLVALASLFTGLVGLPSF